MNYGKAIAVPKRNQLFLSRLFRPDISGGVQNEEYVLPGSRVNEECREARGLSDLQQVSPKSDRLQESVGLRKS